MIFLGAPTAGAEDAKPTKLSELRAKYDSKIAETFSELEELKTRYSDQLEKLVTTAQYDGDLELVLAARDEQKAFRDREGALAEPSRHAALARLQKIYVDQSAKLTAERNAKIAPISAVYRDQLDVLIKELTKEGNLDLAVEAKKERTTMDEIVKAGGRPRPAEPVTGRFVRVELLKHDSLSLAEVEVFSGAKNIARKGKATQSSTHGGTAVNPIADKAIDGDTNGDFLKASTTHTKGENNPWWEVDLLKDQELTKVVIWNRTDSNQRRLDGFKLSILDANRKAVWEMEVSKAPDTSLEIELVPSK